MKKADKIPGLTLRLKQIIDEDFGGIPNRFAKALGISPGSLSAYLNGDSIIGGEIFFKIVSIAKRSSDWLLTGEDVGAKRPVNSVEYKTPEEKEYLEMLLRVIRSDDTSQTTMTILDAVLTSKSEAESPPVRPRKSRTGTR